MPGLGTVINVAAIILGGMIGRFGKRWLSERCQETITRGMGVCVIFVAIAGALEEMLTLDGRDIVSGGSLMLVVSVAIGALIGEILDIDRRLDSFGEWLKKKTGNQNDRDFMDAFVSSTMTVCIGAMAVVGAVKDGIYGDWSILAAKSMMDFIIILVMSSSMGKGCIFSAIPVALFQGTITLLARLVEPLLTVQALSYLSLVGSVLIFCVGLNLIWKNTIRVANLLPSLIAAVIYALIGL